MNWKKTKHGKEAWASVPAKYQSDPECLKCHTTGFGEPGGANASEDVRYLQGVQCEACHSSAGPHDGEGVSDYEERCVRCHTSARDPVFNYSSGVKKLSHP
jgi:hypothetical protein